MIRTTKTLLQTILVAVLLAGSLWLAGNFLVQGIGLPKLFWVVLLAGGAGGFVQSLIQNERRFVLCETRVESMPSRISWTLGSLGDVIVGVGGGLALMFLFSGTLNVDFEKPTLGGLILLTSVSFVAGVVARPLIEAAGQRLLSRVAKEAEEAKGSAAEANSFSLAILARHERDAGRLEAADSLVDYALRVNASNGEAHLEKGRILKRLAQKSHPLDTKKLEEALQHATEASRIQPTHDAPWYNMACYQALLGKDSNKALSYLKKAVDLDASNKKLAWEDEDLVALRQLPEFERAVGQKPAD